MEQARRAGVEKFVAVGTICAIRSSRRVPFSEDDLWNGYPEETNAPYGLAKKMLLVQAQAYREQYGFNAIYLLPVNLYGPGDNFDLETSHVIPALDPQDASRRAEQRRRRRSRSGATARPPASSSTSTTRAEAHRAGDGALRRPEPVNLGAGLEITIRDLAELIAELTGFQGRIELGPSQARTASRAARSTSRAPSGSSVSARRRASAPASSARSSSSARIATGCSPTSAAVRRPSAGPTRARSSRLPEAPALR